MEKPHKRLEVWKQSMALGLEVYRLTRQFPAEERYTLTPQIRRAAISVPSNIAEGAARQTTREFRHFLHIAQASLSELDTQLDLSLGLGYMTPDALEGIRSQLERIDKMLTGLLKSLSRRP